ncbi:hypothetical protein FJQ98_24540 [Lysinibacillus agricola]|uniref:Uncharacterized protein n=1 Tax=Lysinibacillus agricola TaxID=2590012 RepID=A0ABX7AR17_9BACI|nr:MULTISPECIES: hypothetical protein [Lysinibacillus]QQP12224.1 hypothetical protein FJQ98_24540 [Lysinibacillus agricola]
MIYAKAKRQQHCFLCESEATATLFVCAKAKRQQHCLSVRKRSDSNNYAKVKLI